jgi:hypothetical protein
MNSTDTPSNTNEPAETWRSSGGFGILRSRRELAQECANLANQVSNEGCSFSDGTAFRGLIDEAAAHGERLAEQKARMLLDVMRERDALRAGIEDALMHLDTNYCIDGLPMKDSDAANALRRVLPNTQGQPRPSNSGDLSL